MRAGLALDVTAHSPEVTWWADTTTTARGLTAVMRGASEESHAYVGSVAEAVKIVAP